MPLVTTSGLIPSPAPAAGLVVIQWAVAAGTSDAITAAYSTPNTALTDGLILAFRASAANATTTPSFSPDGLTAEVITRFGGAALVPGDIPGALAECLVRYNLAHTRWELMNPANVTQRLLLNTVIASGTPSSIADTSSFLDTRFNLFEVELFNFVPITTAVQLQCTLQSGGAFQSTSYLSEFTETVGTTVGASGAPTAFLPISAGDVSNVPLVGISGTFKIWNPQSTTTKKLCRWKMAYFNSSSTLSIIDGGGLWNGGSGAITGIQFAHSSGAIANGSLFRVYGMT